MDGRRSGIGAGGDGAGRLVCTLRDETGVVIIPKMVARSFIAAICSVPRDGKGEFREGLLGTVISSWAAAVAASAEDVAGILVAWGGN